MRKELESHPNDAALAEATRLTAAAYRRLETGEACAAELEQLGQWCRTTVGLREIAADCGSVSPEAFARTLLEPWPCPEDLSREEMLELIGRVCEHKGCLLDLARPSWPSCRGSVSMKLRVNGQAHDLEVPADMPLLWVLRDVLGLTGAKFGCGMAQCGACTVHVGEGPARSCVLPVSAVGDRPVTTIEGFFPTSPTPPWSRSTARSG